MPTRVELLPFDLKRLDSLAIENVLDPLLKAGQKFRSGGDFSHVVMELDQVNEDGPQRVEQQILFVFLQLRVQAVNDFLARRLRANSRSN